MNKIFKRILFPNQYSSNAYVKYLRKKGILIGENTVFYSPIYTSVDVQKKGLIKIGDNCKITHGVIILAHDYSISVSRKVYGSFMGGTGPVSIGNNCFLGMNCIILKNSILGSNCIVGAGSVVSGEFPDNVVIAGNPAKIICTLEEYYEKCKNKWVDEAKKCAQTFYNNTGRRPTIDDLGDGFYWMYNKHDRQAISSHESFFNLSADNYEDVCKDYLASKPIFENFEEFLKFCNL